MMQKENNKIKNLEPDPKDGMKLWHVSYKWFYGEVNKEEWVHSSDKLCIAEGNFPLSVQIILKSSKKTIKRIFVM
jgi:hypothetical protein